MKKATKIKSKRFKKDIFFTGEYVQYFRPDDRQNPFSRIYNQKKIDVIHIIKNLENCNTILDIGGGMGRLSLTLAETTQFSIILSDLSVDMLKLAIANAKSVNNLNFVNTDAHQLPYRDNSYDLVVGLDLLCHLQNPESALKEFNRVLKNNGILIIDSTNSNPLWTLFYPHYLGKNPLNWLRAIQYKGVSPGWEKIVRHYPKKRFLIFLRQTGFEVIHNKNYGPAICPKWHLAVSKKTGQGNSYNANFAG